jgi:hypothetical protein
MSVALLVIPVAGAVVKAIRPVETVANRDHRSGG